MLFKILHGDPSNISLEVTPFHEGWAYVTHDGFFYIDLNVGTEESPDNQRLKINANEAEKLLGYDIATVLNDSDIEIPTSRAVLDALTQKTQVQIITPDTFKALSALKIYKLTQAEYNQKVENNALEDNAIYLTPEEEIDLSNYVTISQLDDKANATHDHDDAYDAKNSANNALIQAKSYANTVANAIKNDLLNGAGAAYDTLKELGDLIDENVNAIEALETVASNKADTNHIHNDIYYTETEIDEKVSTINASIVASLNEAKSYSDTNLNTAKSYTNNAVAQKSQVQIITWEADD